ncbi:MAG: hypothetical protein RLW42_19455, partial [Gammaproteobacteria bacterium]
MFTIGSEAGCAPGGWLRVLSGRIAGGPQGGNDRLREKADGRMGRRWCPLQVHRHIRYLLALLFTCAALGGCSTPSIQSSPLANSEPRQPPMVVADDVLDLRFVHRPLPQAEPYRIGFGDKLR